MCTPIQNTVQTSHFNLPKERIFWWNVFWLVWKLPWFFYFLLSLVLSTENKSESCLCNILSAEEVCQERDPQEVFPSFLGLLLSSDSCLPPRQLWTRDLAAQLLEMVAGPGPEPGPGRIRKLKKADICYKYKEDRHRSWLNSKHSFARRKNYALGPIDDKEN